MNHIYDKILVLTALSIITSGMLAVTVVMHTDYTAFAKKYKKSQTIEQVNNCGNYILPTNITCSKSISEEQGDDNSVDAAVSPSVLPFP